MQETPDDLASLQGLLDRSYATAGAHLLGIHTPPRRLGAVQVAEKLTDMCLLALATITADGRPRVGPVDGIFFRGAFHFGSAADSLRMRHLRRRPQVSATHVPSEQLAVTVHGRAQVLDLRAGGNAAFRQTLLDVYVPRYGPDFAEFLGSAVYARIEPERMFAFWSPAT